MGVMKKRNRVSYYDGGDADTGEHLFDQTISVIQGLYNQALLSGHLQEDFGQSIVYTRTIFLLLCV